MSGSDWLAVVAGVGVLALVGYDVFVTVLHHWGRTGPIGRAVTYTFWRTALRATRRLSKARRRSVLGAVGPALIPLVVGLWAFLVVLGFALLYVPGMPEGFDRWDRALPVRTEFGDAFYFSGYTFFTLGYGDIAPITNTLRFLAIVQSGAGFALITLVISYFVSVYDAYTQKTVLAQSLHYQASDSANAAALLCNHLAGDVSSNLLANTVGRLRDGIVRLRFDYSNYPILHFFRDPEPDQSFIRLLFLGQDLTLMMDTLVDSAARPDVAGLGGRSGLSRATSAAQGALVKSLLRQVPQELRGEDGEGEPDWEHWAERCRASLTLLRECGIAVREEGSAIRDYCDGRKEWEPLLRACAAALGEDWEEVTGGY